VQRLITNTQAPPFAYRQIPHGQAVSPSRGALRHPFLTQSISGTSPGDPIRTIGAQLNPATSQARVGSFRPA